MTAATLRCPRCGGALKPGAQWCGLCYADLRPPPPPQPPPEPPAAPAPPPPVFTPVPLPADPSAPADPAEAEAETGPPKGWPCLECGTLNAFEQEACVACGTPFGAPLRTPAPALPGDRRTRIAVAAAVVAVLMAIIALLSMATGGEPIAPSDEPSVPAQIEVDG